MRTYQRFLENFERTPHYWLLDSGVAAILVGAATGTWTGIVAAALPLSLCMLVCRLRRYYLIVWAFCWATIWWQVVTISQAWLRLARDAIERLPLYVAILSVSVFLLYWMLGALMVPATRLMTTRTEEPPAAPRVANEYDPYRVLGLSPSSTAAELKSAYRHLLAQYHPDKVAHLGEGLRTSAEEYTRAIRKAFDTIQLKFTNREQE